MKIRPRKPGKALRLPGYEERRRICGEKVRYDTVEEANRYIRENPRARLSYYRCPVCRGLHITSD